MSNNEDRMGVVYSVGIAAILAILVAGYAVWQVHNMERRIAQIQEYAHEIHGEVLQIDRKHTDENLALKDELDSGIYQFGKDIKKLEVIATEKLDEARGYLQKLTMMLESQQQ